MFSSLTGWLKLGGGVFLVASFLWAGFQVATWRAEAIEATRLRAENERLAAQVQAEVDKQKVVDTERVAISAEIETENAELKAQIADLQEQAKATVTTDPACDISEDTVGILNRASGH